MNICPIVAMDISLNVSLGSNDYFKRRLITNHFSISRLIGTCVDWM